jgi:hypothetical protein
MAHGIVVETAFPSDYDFEVLEGIPHKSRLLEEFRFTGHSTPGSGFVVLRVSSPHRAAWLGIFQGEYETPPAISGVFTCPSMTDLCVVSGGQGYLIDVRSPSDYKRLPCFPITSAAVSPGTKQIVLSDFTTLACLDRSGVCWISDRACYDEAEILEVADGWVRCRGWSLVDIFFNVDLRNGKIVELNPLQ